MQNHPNGVKKFEPTDTVSTINFNTVFKSMDDKFGATGHTHDGTAGNGPKITSAGLAENAVTDAVIGNRTISDAVAPAGDTGTLTSTLGWLANMIKMITGKSNWLTAPRTTSENAVKRDGDTMTGGLSVPGIRTAELEVRDGNGTEQLAIRQNGDIVMRGTTMVPTRIGPDGAVQFFDRGEWKPVGTDFFRLTPNIQTYHSGNLWSGTAYNHGWDRDLPFTRNESVDILSVNGKGILGKASIVSTVPTEGIYFVIDGVENKMTSGYKEGGVISLEAPVRFNSSFMIRLKTRRHDSSNDGHVTAELITMMA